MLDGERYKLGLLRHTEPGSAGTAGTDGGVPASLAPGELAATKDALYVGTGDRELQITRIQPPGKKMMDADAWVRGRGNLFDGNGSDGNSDTAVFDTADTTQGDK